MPRRCDSPCPGPSSSNAVNPRPLSAPPIFRDISLSIPPETMTAGPEAAAWAAVTTYQASQLCPVAGHVDGVDDQVLGLDCPAEAPAAVSLILAEAARNRLPGCVVRVRLRQDPFQPSRVCRHQQCPSRFGREALALAARVEVPADPDLAGAPVGVLQRR